MKITIKIELGDLENLKINPYLEFQFFHNQPPPPVFEATFSGSLTNAREIDSYFEFQFSHHSPISFEATPPGH